MNILITGGTGLIGRHFIEKFESQYHFTVLTRDTQKAQSKLPQSCTFVSSLGQYEDLDQFEAVINLAGEPIVDKRWTSRQKDVIESSRFATTEKLSELISASEGPPSVLISGSAIGYYGRQDAQPIDEQYVDVHDEFSHRLCAQWESLAQCASSSATRVCILRTGIVLASDGGALDKMLLPFNLGLGGPIASGKQYMSWIHIDDMVNAIHHLLVRLQSQGIYNLTAPNPETNKAFAQKLCTALHRPCLLPMPEYALRLLMGEGSDLLIYGQNVIPNALLSEEFSFRYLKLEDAFSSLIN